MNPRSRALAILSNWTPPSPQQALLRDQYLTHVQTHADGLQKQCFPHHLTAGLLVTSHERDRVLLNLHGKARRWFAFGGHIEPEDVDLRASAHREGTEESGIQHLLVEPEPVQLASHLVNFCDPRGPVTHFDVRFVARVDADVSYTASEESLRLGWFWVDDLPTDEPDMVELVRFACLR